MAKQVLPPWQQVLLTALNNTPDASNGQEAWEKLNDGEKAAVMAFLAGQVGEDKAQEALEETIALVRRKWAPAWLIVVGILIVAIAIVVLYQEVLEWPTEFLHIALWLMNAASAVKGAKRTRITIIWNGHDETQEATSAALDSMYTTIQGSTWTAMRKGWFFASLLMAVMWCVGMFI